VAPGRAGALPSPVERGHTAAGEWCPRVIWRLVLGRAEPVVVSALQRHGRTWYVDPGYPIDRAHSGAMFGRACRRRSGARPSSSVQQARAGRGHLRMCPTGSGCAPLAMPVDRVRRR
jgi:hypothetical protein